MRRLESVPSTSPSSPRNEHGTPLLDAAFRIAAERRRNQLLGYVNADILLPRSLADAARDSAACSGRFSSSASAGTHESTLASPRRNRLAGAHAGARSAAPTRSTTSSTRAGSTATSPHSRSADRPSTTGWSGGARRRRRGRRRDVDGRALHEDHSYAHIGTLSRRNVEPGGGSRTAGSPAAAESGSIRDSMRRTG